MQHLNLGQPLREEFLAWQEHPVSRWVFRALEAASEAQKSGWMQASWDQQEPNPVLLAELRSRSDALRGLFETEYDRWCELNGQDPKAGEA